MNSQLKRDLVAISGGFLIIMLSPLFNSYSPTFYYTFMIAGIIIAISGGISFFKDNKKQGKDRDQK
ncbi:hypothetical protein [Bombilactobacillus bombi]|jgi:hypothetical protein|uniref:DUF3188 domain-containing protein n=1 Tax=Bombilactobacillus bombi TaxID=1303590 RepID=A0A347SSG9_9LACO|nr:hypothetical protein [Bombilactobacillus bombi]AXX64978.1 hypothetical protein DS830_05615 [Bombilactobacillus bombi]MCO6541018.1 hypothetical protein [Lactobacillus sp.]RHW48756.1 hypothetical protein DS832_00465 [Bombilactobacillus bombi]RHW51347.1 hypothetical protein DS831_04820 [Bombilactobacillus bombi]